MLVFDPKEQSSPDYYHRKRRQGRDLLKKANRDIRFAFDQVYDMEATNAQVYEKTMKTALDALLDGFNCSGADNFGSSVFKEVFWNKFYFNSAV